MFNASYLGDRDLIQTINFLLEGSGMFKVSYVLKDQLGLFKVEIRTVQRPHTNHNLPI